MPTHSSPIPLKRPIPASRKAVIYLGTAISAVGGIVFLSGFFTFGAGFIEFSKPRPLSQESFDREEQIFSQMAASILPRWFGGMVLMIVGGVITAVGKKGIIGLAEEDPKQPNGGFYIEKYFNEGGSMSENRSINIHATSGSNVVYAGNDISGTVTTTINQLQQTREPNTMQLVELLRQVQEAIETESILSVEDKAEALEQVKTLAEAGQKPEDNVLQKAAKTSMKILKGTAASLPDAAKLAESFAKLLPAIATLLTLV